MRECIAILTAMLKWDKKSAPRIGAFTWACVKIHRKDLRKPKSVISDISPYVSIFDPFAARSVYEDNLWFRFGIWWDDTDLCTKNKYPVFLSRM